MVDTHIAAIGAIVYIGPRIVPLVAAVIEIVPMKRLVEMAIAISMKKLIEHWPAMGTTVGMV